MKGKGKYIVMGVIALLLLSGWGFDSVRVKDFSVDVLSVTPDPGIADGQTPITIKLHVSHNGKPCEGHILYAVTYNGGSFKAKRVETDVNGNADFIYYPYIKSKLNELTDVTIEFTDESNSLFIAVPARAKLVIRMVEPDEENNDKKKNDDMFGAQEQIKLLEALRGLSHEGA